MCAGFPCQPFSKAGLQEGFNDKTRGNLFYSILKILDGHPEVKFILLENVRNLADKEDNWNIIISELTKRKFIITKDPIILSPDDFGIPQSRERVYILGIKKSIVNRKIIKNETISLENLQLDKFYKKCAVGDAWSILENNVDDKYLITKEQEQIIKAWDEFRKKLEITESFPIWVDYFGVEVKETRDFYSSIGYNLMPKWKQRFVKINRELYLNNKNYIDIWIDKFKIFQKIKLYRKFEWHCGEDIKDIHDTIIQIRQSGIRIKRPTFYPSLVAMVNTPIIWDRDKRHFRYITPREAANLQSFRSDFKFQGTDAIIYKQLGNAVNVRILKILGRRLFNLAKDNFCEG